MTCKITTPFNPYTQSPQQNVLNPYSKTQNQITFNPYSKYCPELGEFLLQENGLFILQESGSRIIL